MYKLKTKRGYDFGEATSAMQKAIRRADAEVAGYFAVELLESGFGDYVWRRLLTIAAEDCADMVTAEIYALCKAHAMIRKAKPGKGRVFVAKATLVLCTARKCRDADHLTNLVYDAMSIPAERVEALLREYSAERDVPDYSFDCHTIAGRRAGKTKREFFIEEFEALNPRIAGKLDHLIAQLKSS